MLPHSGPATAPGAVAGIRPSRWHRERAAAEARGRRQNALIIGVRRTVSVERERLRVKRATSAIGRLPRGSALTGSQSLSAIYMPSSNIGCELTSQKRGSRSRHSLQLAGQTQHLNRTDLSSTAHDTIHHRPTRTVDRLRSVFTPRILKSRQERLRWL